MDITTQIGSLVIVIAALCEALKYLVGDSRWIPLLSVVLGVAGAILIGGADFLSAASGIIIGLSTTGGYALIKTSVLNK